jgi:hypothetical protein
MKIQKKIRGYDCEMQTNDEGTYCYVSKGKYTASLGYLDDSGCLYDVNMNDGPAVPPLVVAEIMNWAMGYGY